MTTVLPERPRIAVEDAVRELVLPALSLNTLRFCPNVSRVAGYHSGWLDSSGELIARPVVEMLLPALAVLSAQAVGAEPGKGVAAAVAVEFAHDGSLLHHDVMDGNAERRRRPAAWTLFGPSAAILAGDALLAAATEVLLEASQAGGGRAARRLLAAVRRLIAGHAEELDFRSREDVSPERYLSMVRCRTAALYGCAASLGAELVGGHDDVVTTLAEFGTHIGIAHHLRVDLLGIWGDPGDEGEPAFRGLRARRWSAPIAAALSGRSTAARRLRALYHAEGPLSDGEAAHVAVLVEECGGRHWCEDLVTRHSMEAAEVLDRLHLDTVVAGQLMEIGTPSQPHGVSL